MPSSGTFPDAEDRCQFGSGVDVVLDADAAGVDAAKDAAKKHAERLRAADAVSHDALLHRPRFQNSANECFFT